MTRSFESRSWPHVSPQARLERVMFWLDRGVISQESARILLDAPVAVVADGPKFRGLADWLPGVEEESAEPTFLDYLHQFYVQPLDQDATLVYAPPGHTATVKLGPATAEEAKPDARCPRCDRSTAPEHMVLFCEQRKGGYGETEVVNGYKCKCWHCEHTWEVM